MLSDAELTYARDCAESSFPHTCNVYRREFGEDDQGGFTESWNLIWGDIRCRFATAKLSAVADGDISFVQQFTLTVKYDQAIEVGDRVEISASDSARRYEVSAIGATSYDTAKRVNLVALGPAR